MALVLLPVGIACSAGAGVVGGRAGTDQGAQVLGRVVDHRGKPLAGVRVAARTSSMGQLLGWGVCPETRTDAAGLFKLALPFGDIRYDLSVQKVGYAPVSLNVMPEEVKRLRLTLKPFNDAPTIGGVVLDPNGQAVRNTAVRLIGEYGLRATTKTNDEGSFEFSPSHYISQGVALVEAGGLVSPLRMVRRNDANVVLALGMAAQLRGTVHDRDNGKPVAGATVIIRPSFTNDFRLETTSARDGTFDLTGIPPGKYLVTAISPTHFDRPHAGRLFFPPEVELWPGQARGLVIEMRRVATVRGQVVDPKGRPVAGALVDIRAHWCYECRDQSRYVEADQRGRFAITTGHLDAPLDLVAYSARHGLAYAKVAPVVSGEVRESPHMQLPGAARVRGVVTDGKGRPVKDVLCLIERLITVADHTDANGRFDLGRVSLRHGFWRPYAVTFRAPRPQRRGYYGTTKSFDIKYYTVKGRDTAPQFFHHRRLDFVPKPVGQVRLNVVLEPTQLLELTGMVVDDRGDTIQGAKVHLFTGDARPETWLKTLNPVMTRGILPVYDTVLNGTRTGNDGRWKFWTVREKGPGNPIGGWRADWTKYCVGVQAPGGGSKLVRNIVVPKGRPRRQLTITLRRERE